MSIPSHLDSDDEKTEDQDASAVRIQSSARILRTPTRDDDTSRAHDYNNTALLEDYFVVTNAHDTSDHDNLSSQEYADETKSAFEEATLATDRERKMSWMDERREEQMASWKRQDFVHCTCPDGGKGTVPMLDLPCGVICLRLRTQQNFKLKFWTAEDDTHSRDGIEVEVMFQRATITVFERDDYFRRTVVKRRDSLEAECVIDPDINCIYWFGRRDDDSDRAQRTSFLCGKGEVVKRNALPSLTIDDESVRPDIRRRVYSIIGRIESCQIPEEFVIEAEFNVFAMISAGNVRVSMIKDLSHLSQMNSGRPGNNELPRPCKLLYSVIADLQLKEWLPGAINRSIQNENGWCYKKLVEKAAGKADKRCNYLRITCGTIENIDSPGAPFVLEIWPPNCYSPIHNHGGSYAIIKVLAGRIECRLFPTLSTYHLSPTETCGFQKDDVTFMTPYENQFHQLVNTDDRDVCLTIQCYKYGDEDHLRYGKFDYIVEAGKGIHHFDPSSDCEYQAFENILRKEYYGERKRRSR